MFLSFGPNKQPCTQTWFKRFIEQVVTEVGCGGDVTNEGRELQTDSQLKSTDIFFKSLKVLSFLLEALLHRKLSDPNPQFINR